MTDRGKTSIGAEAKIGMGDINSRNELSSEERIGGSHCANQLGKGGEKKEWAPKEEADQWIRPEGTK